MRLVCVLVSFVTLLATAVLAVAVVKLRRDLASTRSDLAALRESCREAGDGFAWADGDEGWPTTARAPERAVPAAPRLAPAALAPASANRQAAAPSLAAPEVRAEVKQLVAEQLAEERQQRQAVREQREQQRRERLAVELGLTATEKERFLTVLDVMQAEWRQLREQARAGDKTMAELRPEMSAVRQKADQALRELLGEDRMQKYQSLSASQRGSGAGMGPPRSAPAGR
jgi:hypothetical protein